MSSITPIELSNKPDAAEIGTAPHEGLVRSTARYMLRTEVHTFAFSVAANSILSFFPFLLLLMTLIRYVFRSRVMYAVIENLLRDYIPTGQEFVIRNLNALVTAHHRAQVFSLAMLLVTSTGIFVPLEVALNRVWGFPNNRSYLRNQWISLGLVFACGTLALLSVGLTAGNVAIVKTALHGYGAWYITLVDFITMKVFSILSTIAIFFPRLLAVAEWKGAGSRSAAGGGDYGIAVGGAEVRLYFRAALAEFCGSVWTIRDLGQPDVLVVLVGHAAADGSASVGAENRPDS